MWICLPGASDSSRVPKGSGTINSDVPESKSRIVDGLSPRKEEQVYLSLRPEPEAAPAFKSFIKSMKSNNQIQTYRYYSHAAQ